MIPRHKNPTRPERTAVAPYNFVPLPEKVYCVEEGSEIGGTKVKPWERHDEFIPGANHGWIDLEIRTLTPLFIRGAVARDDHGRWDDRDSRVRHEPFLTPEGTPAIPGSSLRGMVRTLVEILSFAKIQPVSDQKPFFRTVSDDRIGREYRARVLRGGQKPTGGFVRRDGDSWYVAPCEVVRVSRQTLAGESVPFQGGPNYSPNWDYQYRPCWLPRRADSDEVEQIIFQDPKNVGWAEGTLVLTGNSPSKKREFVFLDEAPASSRIRIPEEIWERFHDDDQITQWQERAFPVNRPSPGCRRIAGGLRDGEPVFFLKDESEKTENNPDGLVFLGRAQMFRFPYDLSPAKLVPEFIRHAGLDLAEAMFGRVGKDKKTIKGRVFFEDAVASDGGPEWLEEVIVPRILSSPKVTTFQHYLTQDGTKGKDDLTTYFAGDQTTIRGHKLYWHRWESNQGLAQVKEPRQHDQLLQDLSGQNPRDSQHTLIRPVKAGVTFKGRIRFENLTDLELGALLYALQLPEGCAHRLGMGKPLGLGSVQITTRLHLIDRSQRYTSWSETGAASDDGARFRNAFVEQMLRHARESGETMLPGNQGLRRIARLDALFLLLEWRQRPSVKDTRYMQIEGGDASRFAADRQGKVNEFRERPVLPSPHRVVGKPAPGWKGVTPQSGKPAEALTKAPEPPAPVPPVKPAVKPVDKGQTRTGVLHRNKEKGWFAQFEGDDRHAVITNPSNIPADLTDGAAAEFYIEEQSKKKGIKARFERLMESKG
jgi:CRISPR-associated protein (TIGR03986 family)